MKTYESHECGARYLTPKLREVLTLITEEKQVWQLATFLGVGCEAIGSRLRRLKSLGLAEVGMHWPAVYKSWRITKKGRLVLKMAAIKGATGE